MQDRGAEREARSPFPVSTISFRSLLEPEHTQRPVIAASPPTQQGRNPTAPARKPRTNTSERQSMAFWNLSRPTFYVIARSQPSPHAIGLAGIQRAAIRFSLLAVNRATSAGVTRTKTPRCQASRPAVRASGSLLAQQSRLRGSNENPALSTGAGEARWADVQPGRRTPRLHHGARLWNDFEQKPQDLFGRQQRRRQSVNALPVPL
mgnify:FL=1